MMVLRVVALNEAGLLFFRKRNDSVLTAERDGNLLLQERRVAFIGTIGQGLPKSPKPRLLYRYPAVADFATPWEARKR